MLKLSDLQMKVITRLANGSDGAVLVTILEEMKRELRDVGNLKEITNEEVKAHLLASDILETELISRLKIKTPTKTAGESNYE